MSINPAEHELAGQCREATGAPTPSASGPTNLGRGGRNAQSRSPPSFGFDPIEGLATGSVSWLDAQPPFDPGNGGESQGFRVFGSNGELMVGDVGRTELATQPEIGARQLFGTIQRLKEFPDYLEILPGAYAGSVCGRALSGKAVSTIGFERRFNRAFQINTVEQFVEFMLQSIPAPPPNATAVRALNQGRAA